MALPVPELKKRYPLPAYNYRVTILLGNWQAIPAGTNLAEMAGAATVISCTEVSGLKMEVDTVTYRHGFSFLTGMSVLPALPKEVHLSIRKGVTKDGKYLSDWMKLIYPLQLPQPAGLLRKRDLLIDLCDEQGFPVVRWTVAKALPVRLDAPSFKADSSEVAFEQLDLIAQSLKVDYNL